MKILFTGFTSRTIGSDRNVYDYMSNVFVLERALTLAGHQVDVRSVSPETDPCIEEDYDVAIVGIAACQGLSSRFKLGALWTLYKFGSRAAIFPSDGRNIYVFPSSVRTCLTGEHRDNQDGNRLLDPIDYFLGFLQREKNNILDVEIGRELKDVWRNTLKLLPHTESNPHCFWKMLVPTFSWGNGTVYARHFGAQVTTWDPTNIAIPMQFDARTLARDGRLDTALANERARTWVVTSLQDQGPWIKKQGCKWPVVTVGNKRAARKGEGDGYVPERQMIEEYYLPNWGHLAFGYPLADGGWWRMRYIHAGMAGIVTCCDEADARKMPEDYKYSRIMLERFSDEKLTEVAANQWVQLMAASTSVDETVARVANFVKTLV